MGRTDRVESWAEQTGSNHGPYKQGRIMGRTDRVESWVEHCRIMGQTSPVKVNIVHSRAISLKFELNRAKARKIGKSRALSVQAEQSRKRTWFESNRRKRTSFYWKSRKRISISVESWVDLLNNRPPFGIYLRITTPNKKSSKLALSFLLSIIILLHSDWSKMRYFNLLNNCPPPFLKKGRGQLLSSGTWSKLHFMIG